MTAAAAPAASIITVDAGGRLFRTTRYTLLMSGAKYFEALFGPTGTILNGSPSSSWRENYDPDVDERGMFDSSCDDGDGENTPIAHARETKEIFIDRDPELFADVLAFMRSAKLPPHVRRNEDKLEQLKDEAEFFAYDALNDACTKALEDIKVTKRPPPSAKCGVLTLEGKEIHSFLLMDNWKSVRVPPGKVLYLVSATLDGGCRLKRSTTVANRRMTDTRLYTGLSLHASPDYSLWVDIGDGVGSIAHFGIDYQKSWAPGVEGALSSSVNIDFSKSLGICLRPATGEIGQIRFGATGNSEWHIIYWVGDAEAIPGLKGASNDTLSNIARSRT